MSDTPPDKTGESAGNRGEDLADEDSEDRPVKGKKGAGRRVGESTAEDSTGISPEKEEAQDPDSPHLPRG